MTDFRGPDCAVQGALSRMSDLLSGMADDMVAVSEVVSDLTVLTGSAMTAEQISQLQSIDLVYQLLQDLTIISKNLAAGYTDQSDTNGRLQLAQTRAILSSDQPGRDLAPSGRIDLF